MLDLNAITAASMSNYSMNSTAIGFVNGAATFGDNATHVASATAAVAAAAGIEQGLGELFLNATTAAYELTAEWLTAATTLATNTAADLQAQATTKLIESLPAYDASSASLAFDTLPTASPPTATTNSTALTTIYNESSKFFDSIIKSSNDSASPTTPVNNMDHWLFNNIANDNSERYTTARTMTTTTAAASPATLSSSTTTATTTNGSYEFHACDPEGPHFNCTKEDYLVYRQGPQRLPLQQALLVTIIFGGIFITSIVGNVLVCVVIIRHSTLHTATNYYLFSLAVSDLLYLLFGLPSEIVIFWHQYPYLFGLPFCKIRAFISEASTYVSVLTIVAFSMERFLAICHPLHLYAMSGFKRALRIIAILWIVSFISAIPFGILSDLLYERYPKDNSIILESAFCSMHAPKDFPLFELSFIIFFIIPMLLIIILYGRMGLQIRSRTMQQLGVQQGSMHKESRHQQSRKAVIRMLAAVVITFFVCWLPFHIQRLFYRYAQDYQYFQEINEIMFSITGFAYYVSCTINPILYNVMSHRYRVAFKDILCGKRKSVYYNNGFARDQSSFRETTIASSLGGGGGGGGANSGYDRVHSVRIRSIRHVNNAKDRDSIKSNNALWMKKTEFNIPMQKKETTAVEDAQQQQQLATNVVVVVDNGLNGRPKVYTEDEAAQENLINKSNETCI